MTPALAVAIVGALIAVLIGGAAVYRAWGWDRIGVALGLTAMAMGVTSLIIAAAVLGWRGWP